MSPLPDGRRHRPADFYHERTNFDFTGRPWRWLLLSGTVIVIALLAIFTRGLNLGIDFEGGTSWQVPVHGKSASVSDVRSVISPLGLSDAKVLILKGDSGTSVRVQSKDVRPNEEDAVTNALAQYGGAQRSDVSVSTVGPTFGDQVRDNAVKALVVFFGLIALYLTIRFEWKMAVAAIVAVLHDIIVTVGVYAITGFEVTPATVVAFLTILGFSLYDTVVVFDKVKENVATIGTVRGDSYSKMVNRSMNQVLMRSLSTSFVAVLPVASLLFVGSGLFGAIALRDFALALFVGLLTGAYSSIFVATPLLSWWKEREPRYRALRERSALQLARDEASVAAPEGEPEPAEEPEPEPAPAAAGVPAAAPAPPAAARPSSPRPATGGPASTRAPRPRQQRRRKRR
ncbi:MAG TPA: protein translocase subunit SecF [Acidimicrobiia bacterium]|nr:protein translocase subunit SecF [Acidimicrobiia bacterium]